jgi:hypothetical protein
MYEMLSELVKQQHISLQHDMSGHLSETYRPDTFREHGSTCLQLFQALTAVATGPLNV